MKKSFIIIAMLLVSFTMAAQEKKDQNPGERFFQAKVREMVYRLNITDEQKQEFVKVYKAYTNAMKEAYGEGRPMPPRDGMKKGEKPQKDVANAPKPQRKQMSKEEAVKFEKEKVERQQRVQAVKLQYIDELAKVLDADQLSRFFNVENQIQQKLRNKQQGKGRPGMPGQKPSRPAKGQRPQRPANDTPQD